MIRRFLILVGFIVLLVGASPAQAAQVCGCKKISNARVSRITAGVVTPPCNPVNSVQVCWNDASTPPTDISASVRQTGLQTLADGIGAFINFDTELYDTGGIWSPGTPDSLCAPVDGKYLITAHVVFAPNAGGVRELYISAGGSNGQVLAEPVEDPLGSTALSTSAIVLLNAGSCARILVLQSSGGTLDVATGEAIIQKLN